jgi:hypothetical protein
VFGYDLLGHRQAKARALASLQAEEGAKDGLARFFVHTAALICNLNTHPIGIGGARADGDGCPSFLAGFQAVGNQVQYAAVDPGRINFYGSQIGVGLKV